MRANPPAREDERDEGQKLVVKTESERGDLQEIYEVSPDGQKMTITVRMESRRLSEPIVLLRVYDRKAVDD